MRIASFLSFWERPDEGPLLVLDHAGALDAVLGAPTPIFRPRFFGAGGDINLGRQWDRAPDGRFLVNTVRDVTASLVMIQHWRPPAPR